MSATEAVAQEGTFPGTGGCQIHWREWPPAGAGDLSAGRGNRERASVLIVHGFGEHSGRYGHVAARLNRDGYAVYAPDHHGHGLSEGSRGRIVFADAVADLDRLVDLITERRPGTPLFLLGHSMGGALALRYVLIHAERVAGLILSGPLVQVEGRAAAKLMGRALGALAPGLPLARLDPGLVSRDPSVVTAYIDDPLVHHQPVPAATVAQFLRHAATLPDDVGSVRLPTLILYGTDDGLCAPAGSIMVSQRIGATDLTTTAYEGLYHEIFNEPERDRVLDDLCEWLGARAPRVSG